MLERHGRIFAKDEEDEIDGFDWEAEFGSVRQG
jgi:hypothetical protein